MGSFFRVFCLWGHPRAVVCRSSVPGWGTGQQAALVWGGVEDWLQRQFGFWLVGFHQVMNKYKVVICEN